MQNHTFVPLKTLALGGVMLMLSADLLLAQSTAVAPASATSAAADTIAKDPARIPPPDYVIGPEDVLTVVFWREKDLSGDVIVRPDGKISLPLLNEFIAAGLTPDQLRENVLAAADRYVQDPNLSIVVKEIKSRRVFITGMVSKPGPYSLMAPTTVVQLIAMAGGLQDYADKKNIAIMRTQDGRPVSFRFNYKDVIGGKNLQQNIELKPGDTVIVP
jgi:polysaccharide export outer membrane protein